MAQDISKVRRMETDFINGFVAAKGKDAAKGKEIGSAAPLYAAINMLAKKVESVHIKPHLEFKREL